MWKLKSPTDTRFSVIFTYVGFSLTYFHILTIYNQNQNFKIITKAETIQYNFFYFLFYVSMCLHEFMYMYHMCEGACNRSRRGVGSYRTGSHHVGAKKEPKLGSLWKQQILWTAEPPLQPQSDELKSVLARYNWTESALRHHFSIFRTKPCPRWTFLGNVLASFISTWHKLKSSERETQLRKCLHKTRLRHRFS